MDEVRRCRNGGFLSARGRKLGHPSKNKSFKCGTILAGRNSDVQGRGGVKNRGSGKHVIRKTARDLREVRRR